MPSSIIFSLLGTGRVCINRRCCYSQLISYKMFSFLNFLSPSPLMLSLSGSPVSQGSQSHIDAFLMITVAIRRDRLIKFNFYKTVDVTSFSSCY